MTKIFTALTALCFSLNAQAASGMDLDSILINGDNVRIEYSSKTRDCGVLLDDWGQRVGPKALCRNGEDLVLSASMDAMNVKPGQFIQMCGMHVTKNCTDYIQVRGAGDANGDGDINVIDLMLVYNYIMGYDTGSWPEINVDFLAADMNEDEAVNVVDILLLIEALDLD